MSNLNNSQYIQNMIAGNTENIKKTMNSFTNYFESVDNYINNSLEQCKISIIIFLICYCILISIIEIPKSVRKLFKNNLFKILLILIISYFAMKDIQIVIFIVISYLLSLYYIFNKETFENFNQIENFNQLEHFNNNLDMNNDIEDTE